MEFKMEILLLLTVGFVGYETFIHWDEFHNSPKSNITNNVYNNYEINTQTNPKVIYRNITNIRDFNIKLIPGNNESNISSNLDSIKDKAITGSLSKGQHNSNSVFNYKDNSDDNSQYQKSFRKQSIQVDSSYITDINALKLKYDVTDPSFIV